MAKAKVPNPYEAPLASYFDNTGDGGIRCVATGLSIDKDTHVVICAPDMNKLSIAFNKLSLGEKFDPKKSIVVLYRYDTELVQLQRDQLEEFKKELPARPSRPAKVEPPKRENWQWFLCMEKMQCFIEHPESSPKGCERLGEAIEETTEECKAYLRKLRVSRGDIDNMNITCDYIPF